MVHNFAIDCAYRDLQRRVVVRARAARLRWPHWHVRWGVVGQALRHPDHYHRHYWNYPMIQCRRRSARRQHQVSLNKCVGLGVPGSVQATGSA